MQSSYAELFERDMGTSEAEWIAALPRAIGHHPWERIRADAVKVTLGAGSLTISWSPLPDRRIALLVMKRLLVRFAFEGLDAEKRLAFMKPFDLTIQRGGG